MIDKVKASLLQRPPLLVPKNNKVTNRVTPEVLIVLFRSSIEVTRSSRIVHHAQLSEVREMGHDGLHED